MEEFDSHTEHAQEQSHEAAHESKEKWVTGVALTAAILAAMAAISSMLAGHHEHDAMMHQITASDKWNEYQAKKIKTLVREQWITDLESPSHKSDPETTAETLKELHKSVKTAGAEEKDLASEAKALSDSSRFHDHVHMILAGGVTLFQVAIAVSAISALTRRRTYWLVGIAMGALALGFLTAGLLVGGGIVGNRPPEPKEAEHAMNTTPASFSANLC